MVSDRVVKSRRAEEADAIAAALQQAEGAADLHDLVSRLGLQLATAEQRIAEMRTEALGNVRAVRKATARVAELAEQLARAKRTGAEHAGRARVLESERDAARDVGNAARAALLAEQSKARGAERRPPGVDARVAAAEAERDSARAALLAEQGRAAQAERRAVEADARAATAEAERDAARAGEDAVTRRLLLAESRLRAAEARLARVGTAPPPMPAVQQPSAPVDASAALFWLKQQRGLSAKVRYLHLSRLDRPDGREVRRLVAEAMASAEGAERASVVERLRVALCALRAAPEVE